MTDLNSTFDSVAISYSGNIVAKGKDGVTTTNFTCNCFGEDILFDLNVTSISDNGRDVGIQTAKGSPIKSCETSEVVNNENIPLVTQRYESLEISHRC